MAEKAESQQLIKDLEADIKILNDREREGNMEVERQVCKIHASKNIYPLGLKLTFLLPKAEGESEENVQSNEAR